MKHFLGYIATNSEAIVMYQRSDMILAVQSNASYLSKPKAQSRVGQHFFLSNNTTFPTNNGAVYSTVQIIKQVMSSSAEAELRALYINSKEAALMQQTLVGICHEKWRCHQQNDHKGHQGNEYALPLVMRPQKATMIPALHCWQAVSNGLPNYQQILAICQ